MEKHELDSFLKSEIKKSNDFYDSEADNAKQRIWNGIRPQKPVIPLFYRVLAAACILLLIGLSAVIYSNMDYKSRIDKLAETNATLKLEKQKLESKDQKQVAAIKNTLVDTVFVEKKVVKLKPIVTTTKIIDTVYLKQIVYLEKEQDDNLKNSTGIASISNENKIDSIMQTTEITEISKTIQNKKELIEQKDVKVLNPESYAQTDNAGFEREIIIASDKTTKNKKTRKFKIRFGGNRAKIGKETLALTTKLSN